MTPLDPAASEYFLEIESHFADRRGTSFIFSAKDWALMKSWHADGIPIAVVLEAIDRCFDQRAEGGRKGTISSLRYCRHAVKEMWDERKDLAVGSSTELPESDPRAKLSALAQEVQERAKALRPPTADLLSAAADAILATASAATVPDIEERLMAIEDDLLPRIADAIGREEKESIDREVDELLASYSGLTGATRRKTREANFKRLLRRRVGVPRLSLFS